MQPSNSCTSPKIVICQEHGRTVAVEPLLRRSTYVAPAYSCRHRPVLLRIKEYKSVDGLPTLDLNLV